MIRVAGARWAAFVCCAVTVPAQVGPQTWGTIAVVVPGGPQVGFGAPFAIEVRHDVHGARIAEPFDEQSLAPAVLRREGGEAHTIVASEGRVTRRGVQRFTARVFASGEVVLPAPVLRVREANGTVHTVTGEPTKLAVRSILPDPPGDIEWAGDVRELPGSTAWVWFAAGLLLVGLGAARFLRRRPIAVPAPVAVAPGPPPPEPVLDQLAALHIAADADAAAVTAYYTALAEIVRGYAGRRFSIAAFVRTSEELLRSVAAGGAALAPCLQACDLVKFAALRPVAAAHEATRAAAAQFVRRWRRARGRGWHEGTVTAAAGFGLVLRDPAWLLLVLLLPVLWLCWRRTRVALAFAPAPLLDADLARGGGGGLPRSLRQRLAGLPRLCEVAAVVLAVVALARPVQRLPLPPERLGIDVLLCLDTSSSMAAEDLAPGRSRHDVALELGAEFVQQRAFDRVGFVTFARYPDLRCPPTLDHAAVAELLRAVGMVQKESPEDATGIGTAVARAAEVLGRAAAKGRVVVLLTDGEENVATTETPDEIAPLHAAQLCQALGVRVHGVVVGRGNQKPDGRFVALDTTAVQQLAAQTGGQFFAARDGPALQQVYRDIDALEKVAFAEPRTLVVEWFGAPLLGALLLLAAGWVLARRWLEVGP